jgi:hypothetical protein
MFSDSYEYKFVCLRAYGFKKKKMASRAETEAATGHEGSDWPRGVQSP